MTNKKAGRVHFSQLTTITRAILSKQIKENYAFTYQEHINLVPRVIDSIVSIMINQLENKICVRLKKVGCLTLVDKAERQGARNPKTGEPAVVSARTIVSFRKSRSSSSRGEFGINDMCRALAEAHPTIPVDNLKFIYRAFISAISRCTLGDQRIELRGLGTFTPSFLPAKEKRNPRTGDKVLVDDRYAIRFNCSSRINKHLNPA